MTQERTINGRLLYEIRTNVSKKKMWKQLPTKHTEIFCSLENDALETENFLSLFYTFHWHFQTRLQQKLLFFLFDSFAPSSNISFKVSQSLGLAASYCFFKFKETNVWARSQNFPNKEQSKDESSTPLVGNFSKAGQDAVGPVSILQRRFRRFRRPPLFQAV